MGVPLISVLHTPLTVLKTISWWIHALKKRKGLLEPVLAEDEIRIGLWSNIDWLRTETLKLSLDWRKSWFDNTLSSLHSILPVPPEELDHVNFGLEREVIKAVSINTVSEVLHWCQILLSTSILLMIPSDGVESPHYYPRMNITRTMKKGVPKLKSLQD